MARKYKFHIWYSVIWMDNHSVVWHCRDKLTKKEAKEIARLAFERGAYRVDIVKRLHSKTITDGVIDIEAL